MHTGVVDQHVDAVVAGVDGLGDAADVRQRGQVGHEGVGGDPGGDLGAAGGLQRDEPAQAAVSTGGRAEEVGLRYLTTSARLRRGVDEHMAAELGMAARSITQAVEAM